MLSIGTIAFAATADIVAARTDDKYAIISPTPRSLPAFCPILVIDGQMKPRTISGTQNETNCPISLCAQTITCII